MADRATDGPLRVLAGIDSCDSPDAEALLEAGKRRDERRLSAHRELVTQTVSSVGFVLAARLIAALAPWHRSLSGVTLVLVRGVWIAVERVKFPVADGWTAPTMLAFVPALFVLPTPLTPLVAWLALILGRAPELVRSQ